MYWNIYGYYKISWFIVREERVGLSIEFDIEDLMYVKRGKMNKKK